MLGYCGINCLECRAYKGTVTGDEDLLKAAAGAYWDGAFGAREWVCLGCGPQGQGILAKYCQTCKIRLCAESKGVQNCAACADYDGCARIRDFIKGESESLVRTMTWLRERHQAAEKQAG